MRLRLALKPDSTALAHVNAVLAQEQLGSAPPLRQALNFQQQQQQQQ